MSAFVQISIGDGNCQFVDLANGFMVPAVLIGFHYYSGQTDESWLTFFVLF